MKVLRSFHARTSDCIQHSESAITAKRVRPQLFHLFPSCSVTRPRLLRSSPSEAGPLLKCDGPLADDPVLVTIPAPLNNPTFRNNHLRQHRQALHDATAKISSPVRHTTIHTVHCDRITLRGNNHQSLRANKKDKNHEDVSWQFFKDTDELLNDKDDCQIVLGVRQSRGRRAEGRRRLHDT